MSLLRIPARIACGLLLVVAFFLVGPLSEHEPAPWIVISAGAVLGAAGVGLGGVAVSFTGIPFSYGLLRDHLAGGALVSFVLGVMCVLAEPFGKTPDARRPRAATAAFAYALALLPVAFMNGVIAADNTRHAEAASPAIAFGALVLGGPLLYYMFSAIGAAKAFPALGGKKRLAFAGLTSSILWGSSLVVLATYLLNRR